MVKNVDSDVPVFVPDPSDEPRVLAFEPAEHLADRTAIDLHRGPSTRQIAERGPQDHRRHDTSTGRLDARIIERWADTDRLNAANGGNLLSAEEGLQSQWGDRPPEKFRGKASP